MRLIDADKMIADMKAMERVYDAIALDGMIRGIERQPTVDAVEVTRCKNCIMAMKLDDKEKRLFARDVVKCGMMGCIMLANDFCSYGEKADGGEER